MGQSGRRRRALTVWRADPTHRTTCSGVNRNQTGSARLHLQEELALPRYYFKIVDGTALKDPSGLDCRDDKDALAKARIIASEIATDARVHNRAGSPSRITTAGKSPSFR